MKPLSRALRIAVLPGLALLAMAYAQESASPPQPVTTIDAALGRCSLDLAVVTADGKPALDASVKVHIAYGFGGFRKLDLEAGANAEGKVKFTGLPASVRRPPLLFHAFTRDRFTGDAEYDPAAQCHAQRTITVTKANP